jgi:AcrR family transcriptional regulator
VATGNPSGTPRPPRPPRPRGGERTETSILREEIVDLVTGKVHEKLDAAAAKQEEKLRAKRDRIDRERGRLDGREERHVQALERLANHLDALEVWTRGSGGSRRPRFSREEIAAAALRIADTEGFEALSMRRLAAELGAGTMTLYHYIRTKDELLTLLNDAVMAEVVVPPEIGLPTDWRAALTLIADRTRASFQNHPWVFDITDDPPLGPSFVRHFDQTMQAVSGLGLPFVERLDIATLVDEYVFGYCMNERNNLGPQHEDEQLFSESMVEYMAGLLATGDYPELERLVDEIGLAECLQIADANARDPERFHRNLEVVLDGIEASLERRRTQGRELALPKRPPGKGGWRGPRKR